MLTKEEYQAIVVYNGTLHQKQSLDSTVNASRTDQEANVPIVLEKPSEDGYNWRKYGQKNVKGYEYIRSYYKCSYPNCLAKKQVERSPDGWITDITYLGKHDHPKPHTEPQEVVPSFPLAQVKTLDCPPAAVKDKTSDVHAPITDNIQPQPMDMCERPTINKYDACVDSPPFVANVAMDFGNENMTPKRRKRSVDGADIMTEKPTRDSRLVVHTVSDVDIVNDGYRWRKYGQKMVKGSPNPRSYYRCSTAGCSVKKHVERASYDPKVVITTYEGEHDHTIRPIRVVAPESQSLESDATQNGSAICEKVKNNAIVLYTAKEITTKEVVNTAPEIPPDGQSVQPETKRSDHSEQQMQDSPVSTALKSDNIDNQTVKQEKVAPVQEMKINAVSTKPQRPDNCDSQTVKQEKPDTVQEM